MHGEMKGKSLGAAYNRGRLINGILRYIQIYQKKMKAQAFIICYVHSFQIEVNISITDKDVLPNLKGLKGSFKIQITCFSLISSMQHL